jgi:hypothetical protein
MDWSFLNREELASSQIPIINLIQHVQHADPDNPRYQFLKEKAIRICVSKEVEHALRKANTVNGPIRTIPNGIDFNELPQSVPLEKRDIDVLVVGIKQWNMTKRIEFLTSVLNLFSSVFKKTKFKFIKKLISRNEFLKHLANSKNCIFLPARTEGFYLPALDGMYLQTRVIVPDCVGNRGFCYDNVNCYMPEYSLKGIFYSLIKALKATPEEHKDMINQAYIFAQKHSIDNEREQYKILLQNVCTLWNEAT